MSQHSSRGREWQATRLAVLKRDGYTCMYCGKPELTGRDATVDHIISKAAGGDDSMTNCLACCAKCNNKKSDRPLLRVAWFDPDWFSKTPDQLGISLDEGTIIPPQLSFITAENLDIRA